MRPRYVELLSDALKVTPSDTDYLADIDDGFYASQYLRAWAFEAQLRDVPAREVRQRVVHRRTAGSLIRELWTEGQKPTADEILLEVTGSTDRPGSGRRADPRSARAPNVKPASTARLIDATKASAPLRAERSGDRLEDLAHQPAALEDV